ncbi:bifunctional 3-(3-hydroxy-phenyl)propionate/3-hydroxycinnamic acid hydroxylase MhpA [Jatrophihabitans fulvus]
MSTPVEPARHVPVVVVGCGPTGATAAIALAQRGVEVLVLDRWPQPYPLPRAVHFDDEVYRVFADLGLGDELAGISRPAPGMQLVDPALRTLATFRRDPEGGRYGYPQSNMFDQPDLEHLLRRRMADFDTITVRGDVEVVGLDHPRDATGRTTVRARRPSDGRPLEFRCDVLLGCDGANSTVRTLIGAGLDDLGFEQRWVVVDVTSPVALDVYDGVQQVCDADRAATFMMVTPGRYRWEFRLRDGEVADDLTDDTVLGLIGPWLGAVDPGELTVVRRAWYTFRGAVADHWRHQNVFLLGDAAHLTPPFIGQGMCAGIRDAANLAWKIAAVLDGAADHRLLDTYESERRPFAVRVVRLAIAVGWVMTGGSRRTGALRRAALAAASRLPGAEDKVINTAMPTLPAGPLTTGHRAAGRLVPHPVRDTPAGRQTLDEVLGRDWSVITRAPARPDAFESEVRDFFSRLRTRFVTVEHTDTHLSAFLDETGARALLVRPDRTVAAAGDRADLRAWREQLIAAGYCEAVAA